MGIAIGVVDADPLGPGGVVPQEMGDQMNEESPEVIDRDLFQHFGIGVDLPASIHGNGAGTLCSLHVRREEGAGEVGVARRSEEAGRRDLPLVEHGGT